MRTDGCTCGKYKNHDLKCPALPMDKFMEKFAQELNLAVTAAGSGEQGQCPSCPKLVVVRKDGTVRRHKDPYTKTLCAGSNRRPI